MLVQGYRDDYVDEYETQFARLILYPRKRREYVSSREGWVVASSVVEFSADHEAVQLAVAAVWAARDTYESIPAFITAIDTALDSAGYTGPGGESLI